jgi:NitT/TauT family transport system substrate-binding protein
MVTRCRAFLLALALTGMPFFSAIAAEPDHLRLGLVKFGSGAWEIDTLRANGLDQAAGVAFDTVDLANPAAGEVALQAGGVDAIITDWLWVSRQRRAGHKIVFIPHSSALGEIVVPGSSPIHGLAALEGHRLGIAGGPLDKSWLLVRAYSRRLLGHDLADHVEVVYGAPPLLSQELAAEHVDAVLTFWPYAARLAVGGGRSVITMDEVMRGLGFTPPVPMIGYAVTESWLTAHPGALTRVLAAIDQADRIMATDRQWDRLRSLTGAPDDATLAALRDRFRAGIAPRRGSADQTQAARLFAVLAETGGAALTDGATGLTAGTFWVDSTP